MATQRERANQDTGKPASRKAGPSSSAPGSTSARDGSPAEEQRRTDGGTKRPAAREAKGRAQSGDSDGLRETDAENEADDQAELETLAGMLLAMAQMDSEAAFAYEVAAEFVDLPEVSARLRDFAADHRRHVADIGKAMTDIGCEPATAAPPPEASVFALLTTSLGMVGPRAVLLALIGSEEFTNSIYDTALDLIVDPELRKLIQRNYDDEQRHITWLSTQARPSEDEEPLATGEN